MQFPIVGLMSLDFGLELSSAPANSRVIERLREIIPFREPLALITSASKPEDFWRWIDTLPSHLSLELHALAAVTPISDRDFPSDTFSPFWQDFWIAHNIATAGDPGLSTPAAVSQVSSQTVESILSANPSWTCDAGLWHPPGCSVGFDLPLLVNLCNSFIVDGNPWFFCAIDEIRIAYIEFDRILDRISDPRHDLSEIQAKLRSFSYCSKEAFLADVQPFSSGPALAKLGDFRCAPQIGAALSELEQAAAAALEEDPGFPAVDAVDEWTRTRADNLVAQVSLPLDQRAAYAVTPQILRARTGQPADAVFTRGSIAELLFSNARGEVMPLPFTNCRSELPTASPNAFVRAVFKAFVAKQLLRSDYTGATQTVLDILTDVVLYETKRVATTATSVRNVPASDQKMLVAHALKQAGYDTYTLRAGPHFVKRS